MTVTFLLAQVALAIISAVAFRFLYNLHFHPLAKFPSPWYTAISSLPLAVISLLKREPEFLLGLTKKYGESTRHTLLPAPSSRH